MADPVHGKNTGPWISPGFLHDFHWIFTGFSLEVQHVVGIILLAQTSFSRWEKIRQEINKTTISFV